MTDPPAHCIVITGLPGSGKSTLARHLAGHYRCSVLAKDAYKERIFDALGWSDRDWSKRVSALAWALLFESAECLLQAGARVIIEGNFEEPQWDALAAMRQRQPARLSIVDCQASDATLIARASARAAGGLRHPGHADASLAAELASRLAVPGGRPAVPAGLTALCYRSEADLAAGGPQAMAALLRQLPA